MAELECANLGSECDKIVASLKCWCIIRTYLYSVCIFQCMLEVNHNDTFQEELYMPFPIAHLKSINKKKSDE